MSVEIRPCVESDIDTLEKLYPSPGAAQWHKERYELQQVGGADYLIAFDGETPVAHCLLLYPGVRTKAFREFVGNGVPEIVALGTAIDRQNQGIGTAMIDACETLTLARRVYKIAVCVEVNNDGAKRLYERLGYSDIGLPPESGAFSWENEDGTTSTHDEMIICLAKDLDPNQRAAFVIPA